MRTLDAVTLILVIIGGINWGLVGIANFNLVDAIFGAGSAPSHIIYAIVGICALYQLVPFARLLGGPHDQRVTT